MADPFGFMKYPRVNNPIRPVAERIKDFEEMENVDQWLERIKTIANVNYNLAVEVANSYRLKKG